MTHPFEKLLEDECYYYSSGFNDWLQWAFERNKTKLIKWLWNDKHDGSYNINTYGRCFTSACQHGNFELVKWLYDVTGGKVDIEYDNNRGFKFCCNFGFINIINWIYNKKDCDDRYINLAKIKLSDTCRKGNIEHVKLLWKFINDDTFRLNESIYGHTLTEVCIYGYLEVAKWLHEKFGKLKNYQFGGYDFYRFCRHGNLKTIKWILEIYGDYIDIRYDNDKAFKEVYMFNKKILI